MLVMQMSVQCTSVINLVEQALIIMYPNICAIIMLYHYGSLVPNCVLCVQDEMAVLGF